MSDFTRRVVYTHPWGETVQIELREGERRVMSCADVPFDRPEYETRLVEKLKAALDV